MIDLIKILYFRWVKLPGNRKHYTLVEDTLGRLRPIEDIAIAGVDMGDWPDLCDAFIESACWVDTWADLEDFELDYINDNERELVYERAVESTH